MLLIWYIVLCSVDRSFTSSSSSSLFINVDGNSTADCLMMTSTLSPVTQGEFAISTIDVIGTEESIAMATLSTNDITGIVAGVVILILLHVLLITGIVLTIIR